ncbi:hypothetical protein PE36_08031 [Moritella sp. PE36]|nr:hypothetical protein PE36_08031 [Moritella sp. PE36]
MLIINFILMPEVMVVAIAILTIYSFYWKWKFRTYGTIDAKLEKLDKLEEIEKKLALAKFDVQMERLDEILDLEKVKAIGSGSVDFEYHQRKEDLERLMEFSKKINLVNSKIISNCRKSAQNTVDLHEACFNDNNSFTINNYIKHNPDVDDTEADLLFNEIAVMYTIYFKEYGEEFDFHRHFKDWKLKVLAVRTFDTEFITTIRGAFDGSESTIIGDNIISHIDTRNNKINGVIIPMNTSLSYVNVSFGQIGSAIKNK